MDGSVPQLEIRVQINNTRDTLGEAYVITPWMDPVKTQFNPATIQQKRNLMLQVLKNTI